MNIKDYEKIFKALANRRRLEIIKHMRQKKAVNVGGIANHIKLSFKSTSRHLAVLLAANILEKEQRSLTVFYSLASDQERLTKAIIKII